MICQEMFVRQRGKHEMVREWFVFSGSDKEVLCSLASAYLVKGWRLLTYNPREFKSSLEPCCRATLDVVLKDDKLEHRFRLSSTDSDLGVFYKMARNAIYAPTDEARLAGLKRDLLSGCGIEEPYEELRKRLSVTDLVGAIIYASRDDEYMDLEEAHIRCEAELKRLRELNK